MRARSTICAAITLAVALLAGVVGRDADALLTPDYEVLVMNAAGGEQRNLTHQPETDGDAAWSPDSARIAFASSRGAHGGCFGDIFVMNADGSAPTQLTDDEDCDRAPAWSPDGTRIAFVSRRTANDDIFVMSPTGSGRTRLTINGAVDNQPSWSPDGSRIAFASDRDARNLDIFVMDADGQDQVNLTATPAQEYGPAWSPDGTQIAFTVSVPGNPSTTDVFVMNADGSGRRNLTNQSTGQEYDSGPSWSPGGTRIAFTSFTTVGSLALTQIMVMNADGSGRTVLTSNPRGSEDPAWSPDGTRIAFSGDPTLEPPPPPPPSGGPPPVRCRVPRVIGMKLRMARTKLRSTHCSVGRVRRLHSRRIGRVIRQRPKPGTIMRRGYPVSLVVGRR